MPIDKTRRENLVRVDPKGRLVLPREVRRSDIYAVELTEKNEIILRPRIAVDPTEVISKKTLAVLDESMQNLAKGKAGKPVDLTGFDDEDNTDGQEEDKPRLPPRRR